MQQQTGTDMTSPSNGSAAPRVIQIRIQSVIEKGDLTIIEMRTDSTVREFKFACKGKLGLKSENQSMLFQGKELTDDDKTLGEYGMQADCNVKLAPMMASGTRVARQADSQVILLIPDVIPKSVKTVADLRETIKTLHMSLLSKKLNEESQDRSSALWTPEKQMEHELTRNRMKELMQRRRKVRSQQKSSSSSSIVALEYGEDLNGVSGMPLMDTGSICGSIGRSPLASELGTPPELRANRGNLAKQDLSSTTVVEPKDPATIPVTEIELKLYFDPPETARQAEMLRRDLYDPPQNRQELEKIKKDLMELQKAICGVCRRRLPLIQQSLKCRCGQSFCVRHQNAEEHKCSVDYKLTGRKKLERENPKLELGGARKAKLDEI